MSDGDGCGALFLGLVIGGIGGALFSNSIWKHDMVERGYANYNIQTGEWQWVEEPTLEGEALPEIEE